MSSALFRGDLAANAWNDLFDFIEQPRGSQSTSRGDRDSNGCSKTGSPTRRERTHARYEEIFCKLTAYFDNRGCGDSEDRAIETILRVALKCRTVTLEPGIEPISYFYGCARNVMHEVYKEWKREARLYHETQQMAAPDPASVMEVRQRCLEDCMQSKLDNDERELIIDYYRGEGGGKIQQRQKLAAARSKDLASLRIETHRIRKKLRPCVSDCVEAQVEGETLS